MHDRTRMCELLHAREMASAFHEAGFDVWDVAMADLVSGDVSLDTFRGIAFVGGFS